MKISEAVAVKVGSADALAIYAGVSKVWPVAPATPMDAWVNALANVANAQARVYWIGDSIFEGTGATARNKRALELLLAQLASDYPVSGQGLSMYVPAVYGCPKTGSGITLTTWGGLWTTSSSGTITQRLSGIAGGAGTPTNTFGPGMRSVDFSGTNATVTYTLYGTDVDVWLAAGGSFTYSVDGGAYSSAVSTAGMNASADIYPIHLGSSGSHTLSIRRSSGTIHLLGFTQFDGARNKGIALYDACHWGAQTKDFWDYSNGTAPQNAKLTRCLQLVAPQLVVINTLINDAGNLGQQGITECVARLTGMLGSIRAAAPSASVAFVQPYDQVPDSTQLSDGNTVGALKAAVATWCTTNEVTLIDLSVDMPESSTTSNGLYQTDGMHLTDAGNVTAADLLIPALDPAYVEPTPADVTYTAWDDARKAGTATISGLQLSFSNQGIAAADMHVDAATANRYWEVTIGSISGNVAGVGIVREDFADWTGVAGYSSAGAVSRWSDGSLDYWVGAATAETTGSTPFAAGDVMALCLKNGALYVGKASAGAVTWLDGCDPETETGAPVTGITGRYGPSVSAYSTGTRAMTANFGASAWVGAPPSHAIGWPHAPTLGAHTMYKGEDYNTATPVVTSALTTRTGSSFLVSRGGSASVTAPPTDNKSNTYAAIGDPAPYAGYGGAFDMRNYMALNGFGGAGHTITLDNSAASTREITMAIVEILDGHNVHLEDFSYTYPAAAATITSGKVTTTGPALLVAVWSGDAGGLTHTAVPSAGWRVIDSFLNLPPNSAVQYAIAVRDVDTAGDYDISWAQTPDQSAPLWVFAFQYGPPVAVPMTLVGVLPNAKVGVPYSASLTLAGDYTEPVTIDASTGAMPAWMAPPTVSGDVVTFNSSTTPPAESAATGWTVRATDSSDPAQVATSAQSVAVTAASFTTWDAENDTVYGISFSNGNLTATCAGDNKGTSALASCGVAVADAHHYYELHVDSMSGSTTFYAGFATSAWVKDGPPGVGYASPADSFSVSSAGTMYLSQSSKGASGLTFAVGDTMLMYLAPGGGVYIGRLRSGTEAWASGHNPKVGGDTPNYTLPAGVWRPACGGDASGSKSAVLTANFGASAWANTPPTGAVGWAG